jgi:ABC-2 type transport system permease protein
MTVRLVVTDPMATILMVIIPLVFVAFLKPMVQAQLVASGHVGATGAEAAVPGLAMMFAFLLLQNVVMLFFREYAWGTWDRVRASGATGAELIVGKAGPLVAVVALQIATVLAVSTLLFGYRANGSLIALALLIIAAGVAVVSFGVLMVALFRTLDMAMGVGNTLGMLMAGLGGALAPTQTLPQWTQALAHITPAYWAIDGMTRVSLDRAGIADIGGALAAVAAFSAVCLVIAAARFRPGDTRVGTT